MAKKESTFFNMLMTLLVVTLVASTALAYVYEITKAPIESAKLAKKLAAIDQVVTGYDNNPVEDMYIIPAASGEDSLEVYPALKNGELEGVAIRSFSKNGYSGLIWVMVGIKPDGTLQDVVVIEHKETPGLGSKMSDPGFKGQFKGLNPSETTIEVKKDGGEIDAITAATISSRAFCDAIQLAVESYRKGGSL
ncbi:MAG: RnfABCDGE type electron transport complex subunit G [Cyclobacteriaceae bacterium]|nr:RnfABCDGE type electron transport complex subunit G [Cyclobacteriaceae bacterium]